MMGKLLASAATSSVASAVRQLRRVLSDASVHETEEERVHEGAVVMESKMQAREERGEASHGLAVFDLNLGSGGNSRKLGGGWGFERASPPS